MGKFDGILICTDLDGTLLGSDREVSYENLSAIKYFKSEGGFFTFVTGRCNHIAGGIYKMTEPNAPYVCLNGGGVYDGAGEKYMWCEYLPKSVIPMLSFVLEHIPDMGIQIFTEKAIYSCNHNEAVDDVERITGYSMVRAKFTDISEEFMKIVFAHHDDEKIKRLASLLREHPRSDEFDYIQSEKTLYEILPKGVSKGSGMKRLASLLGVDKTVAVGDYFNDISMIKAAKVGIAVGNAVDEAKEAADIVTVDNDHSAIAKIIYDIESGKIRI